jgi:hypothetical protein
MQNRFLEMLVNPVIFLYDGGLVTELPLPIASNGAPIIPGMEEAVVLDGKRYLVTNIEWDCDLNRLSVHAHR